MAIAPFALVVLSAVTHAWWNFVLKQRRGGDLFVGLSKVVEVVVMAPFILLLPRAEVGRVLAHPWIPVVGAALVLVNYQLLSRAYALSDLSIAYPVSRGAALAFLPPLAYLLTGTRIDGIGTVALGFTIAGILVIQLRSFRLDGGVSRDHPATRNGVGLAVAAGLATSAYTLWDKSAVGILSPFAYFFAYTLIVSVVYAGPLLWTGRRAARDEWVRNRTGIVQVGVLNAGSYLLLLAALRQGNASYVLGARQLSIVVGVFLGWLLLAETIPPAKQLGTALIVAGCILFGMAR